MRTLAETLGQAFTVEDAGFAQFAASEDERVRAVVSDQTAQNSRALITNFVEGRLHYGHLQELFGEEGIPYPAGVDLKEYARMQAETHMHVAGVVRALGSVFDCLAALAIG